MPFTIPYKDKIKKISKSYLDADFLENIDRNIKTIGGVDIKLPGTSNGIKMLIFNVQDVYDMISVTVTVSVLLLFLIAFTVITGGNVANVGIIAIGIFAMMLSRYTKPLGIFKERFEKELPGVLDVMIQGLSVGLPVETVIEYTANTKDSIVTPFLEEISYRLKAGESLPKALNAVAEKTLSEDFKRAARILSLREESTIDIAKNLEALANAIEDRIENNILSKAQNAENVFFFPIVAGYVIPYIILVVYPLLANIVQFFRTAGR